MIAATAPALSSPRSGGSPAAGSRQLARALGDGLRLVLRSQLRTGEIPAYGRGEEGEPIYRLSLLASTLAHDALACLDPLAPRFEPAAPALFGPPAAARWASLAAAHVRRQIRGFLAWQQRPDGRFGYHGRGSGLPPDAATTACAGAVLLAAPAGSRRRRRAGGALDMELMAPAGGAGRALAALLAHRAGREHGGRFFTFVESGRGWSAIAADGGRTAGFDRVVNAHVLRFLALADEPAGERIADPLGDPTADIAAWLEAEAAEGDLAAGSPDHPDPIVFLHAAARAFAEPGLPGRHRLAAALPPRLRALERPGGGHGGPLATALALTALLDLSDSDDRDDLLAEQTISLGADLLALRAPASGWAAEGYVRSGGGSAGLTSAVAVGALARLAAFAPEGA